jgi:hypothetical protein
VSTYTRSGRWALEEKFKDPGHWHIEGWCALKVGTLRVAKWKATDGPCLYLEAEREGQRWIYATTLNDMRDRIREETCDEHRLR